MLCTKTQRSRNRGTRNCTLSLTSKNDTYSSGKVEKISKYFTKVSQDSASHKDFEPEMALSKNFSPESPYKNCLNEIKCAKLSDSNSELDEFKTPAAVKKVSKIGQSKAMKKIKKRRKNYDCNQTTMKRFLEDNLKNSDVNPDHLQMALVLSESSYQAENPHEKSDSKEKTESFRRAFEKYGFGYNATKNNKDFYEITKKPSNKKSRYRYITPILKIRTCEERTTLISSKVSLILAENSRPRPGIHTHDGSNLFSENLQKYKLSKIFKMNHLKVEELSNNDFYINSLNLEVSSSSVGHLLKNWGNIPGRDVSPIRVINSTTVEASNDKCGLAEGDSTTNKIADIPSTEQSLSVEPFKMTNRSISPDLFASDEEYEASGGFQEKLENFQPREETSEIDLCQSENEENGKICLEDEEKLEKSINESVMSSKSKEISQNTKMDVTNVIYISDDEDEEIEASGINLHLKGGKDVNISGYFGGDWMKFVDEDIKPLNLEEEEEIVKTTENLNVTEPNLEKPVNKDELCENQVNTETQEWDNSYIIDLEKSFEIKSNTHQPKLEKISTSDEDITQQSEESITITDEELNYSCTFITPKKSEQKENKSPSPTQSLLNQTNQSDIVEVTPTHGNLVIKTKNITPMANYDEMDTPKIVKQLTKFGIKPMKRQRGAKMLKYIYESTHPLVEDEGGKVVKKRRTGSLHFEGIVGEIEEEELIFERKPMKKGPFCSVPLHIVWHNFVMSNPQIRENILLYEPLHLEVLHSMLKEQGFRFNIQDLIKFLDQKCVTFRTAQGQRIKTKKPL